MNTLFPEMEKERREERTASRREMIQHARGWLAKPELKQELSWLANYLMDHGPKTEHELAIAVVESEGERDMALVRSNVILCAVNALWLTKKLWRRHVGVHPGSGCQSYLYGLRNVHSPNIEISNSGH